MLCMRRIKALVVKESYQIVRDPSSLLISVFLPLLLLFLYGYGVSLDLDHLRVGVVLEDRSPTARSFLQSLTDSKYFEIETSGDYKVMSDRLVEGSIRGFVVIPSYFTAFYREQDQIAPIQVIADGSETNTSHFVHNYIAGAFQNWLVQEKITHPSKMGGGIAVEPRFWYNEELESRYFLLSGALAIIMTLIGSLLTALVIAREWERGTMEALISTSVQKSEIMIGKLIPYFVLGMLSMCICVVISVFGYGLPLRGSIWLLVLASSAFLFCALSTGLMVSTLSKSQVFSYQVTLIIAFLPAYILSGYLFEISSMPKWIQCLTYIIPAKYFVQNLQTLFLVGNVYRLILWNILPMILIGSVCYVVAARKMQKRLE